MEKINKLKEYMKTNFTDARGSHDWEHTERVYNLCMHIGKIEKVNLEILKYAALLHDIARHEQDTCKGKICHAEKGAEIAFELLKKFDLDDIFINEVVECIITHRFRKGAEPKSKEAKVLFDADKLDSIGAVGIGRAFLFSGEIGAKLHDSNINLKKTKSYSKEDTAYREYLIKLKHVKSRMLTEEGKKLAVERHEFMEEFFSRIIKEIDGII